jgi:nucleoside-diphosphate-sugar epimerase
MAGADVVVHVAARVHTQGFWREFVETTIDGTRTVLAAARAAGVRHFLQLSTVGVYGYPRPDGRPFDERDEYGQPHRWNYYSRAKIEAERLVRAAHEPGRLSTTVLRPTWVYGPRDATSLARLVAALRAGRLQWIGDAQNVLSLVYVTDVADAVYRAATLPAAAGRIYNVATDEPTLTQERFIGRLCELFQLPAPTRRMTYGMAHRLGMVSECMAHATGYRVSPPLSRLSVLLLGGQRRYRADAIQTELGWRPTTRFDDGIRRAVDWFRTAGGA